MEKILKSDLYPLVVSTSKEYVYEKGSIRIIAHEMFSDRFNIVRIAFFLLFIEKVVEFNYSKKSDIYQEVFECLYQYLKLE